MDMHFHQMAEVLSDIIPFGLRCQSLLLHAQTLIKEIGRAIKLCKSDWGDGDLVSANDLVMQGLKKKRVTDCHALEQARSQQYMSLEGGN